MDPSSNSRGAVREARRNEDTMMRERGRIESPSLGVRFSRASVHRSAVVRSFFFPFGCRDRLPWCKPGDDLPYLPMNGSELARKMDSSNSEQSTGEESESAGREKPA